MYHFSFHTCLVIRHKMLIFGGTYLNKKKPMGEIRKPIAEKFVHILIAPNSSTSQLEAKKEILTLQNCQTHPSPYLKI